MDMHFRIYGTTWYLADTREREPGSEVRPEGDGESLLLFSGKDAMLDPLMENPGLYIHGVLIPYVKDNVISLTRTGENGEEEEMDISGIKPRVAGPPPYGDKRERSGEFRYRCRVRRACVQAVPFTWYAVVEKGRAPGERVTLCDCLYCTLFEDWETLRTAVRWSGCRGKVFRVEVGGGITLKEHVADALGGETTKLRETSPQPEKPVDLPSGTAAAGQAV